MISRTVVVNNVEPAILSLRAPLGLELQIGVRFKKQDDTPIAIATILPQLAILPRSRGGIYAYPMEAVDGEIGFGTVTIPGTALVDNVGYNLELYQRRPADNPEDPPVPSAMLAKGTMLLEGSAHTQFGPLGMINVPVVTGPPGPAGPPGERGSIWTTGVGAPVVMGGEREGDMYLNESNGDVWRFTTGAWALGTF